MARATALARKLLARRGTAELPLVRSVRDNRSSAEAAAADLGGYRFRPADYIAEKLGWAPWSGGGGRDGQLEVVRHYELVLRQLHERLAFENGEVALDDLVYWRPGQVIQNWIRVRSGHTVGKTKLASGVVQHFFDCFVPSTGYCFAPSEDQVKDLLFAEIKQDRRASDLPGRILELELRRGDNHWIKAKVTNDSHGRGTERVQGKHGRYLIYVLDEAEGIPGFVWRALPGLTSGGIAIVLMLANPKTRISEFHRVRERDYVRSFHISCLHHPNVITGREVVPGGVQRDYVEKMMPHCEVVEEHDPDIHTFSLPFPVRRGDETYAAGTVFAPDSEFMFRVLGEPPANLSDNTFLPVGRFELAKRRGAIEAKAPDYFIHENERARIGIDVARYGRDTGSIFVRHRNRLWREARLTQQDSNAYVRALRDVAARLRDEGVTSLMVRVDAGGGYHIGLVDRIKQDVELAGWFRQFVLIAVHFNGGAVQRRKYADRISEMYAETAETFKAIALLDPPQHLEADLCERKYEFVNVAGAEVKRIESKKQFKKNHDNRSPDDGDGCVLAAAPDFVFPYDTDADHPGPVVIEHLR